MNVLAVIHGTGVRTAGWDSVIRGGGHCLEEWSLAWEKALPRPLDDYGAVLVFGGSMHADQDDHHPWLRQEDLFLQGLLNRGTPTLGVCLGAQLLAKAAGAPVWRLAEHEIGWFPVELTQEASEDPVFADAPKRFAAFQWHYYGHGLPAGAVELARSQACTQAFRLGDRVWGIQFHAEVTLPQVEGWLAEDEPEAQIDRDEVAAETRRRIEDWSALGHRLCSAFLETAERAAAPV